MKLARALTAVGLAVAVAACTTAGTRSHASAVLASRTSMGESAGSHDAQVQATTTSCVASTYNAMTADQRLGQLFLVGVPVADRTKALATAQQLVTTDHVGGIFLAGRSKAGVYTIRSLTRSFQALATKSATGGVRLVVATDQEGGQVQVLQGSGFGAIPSALIQGQLANTTLRAKALTWGTALAKAGVDLDLAPVADVPVAGAPNPPIAGYDREYGFTTSRVTAKASAFAAGMKAAGVTTSWKHFPGLGRVAANTDTTKHVKDTVTTTTSVRLLPFRAAVDGGAGWVMVSLATYTRIDPDHVAAYSSKVVRGLLRGQLGFKGVVVSDALGAASATTLPVSRRAAAVIAAGGDIALTVEPSLLEPMLQGVRARAASSATFRAQVKASVLRVLTAKRDLGLLPACR